jgi:hypothetical protein
VGGYRVFLAVQIFINPFFDRNKEAEILFQTKDRTFNGGREDIDNLHIDILQHIMRRPHRTVTWNLDGQALSLNPRFNFDVPARVSVVLEQSQHNIEHDPILTKH